MWLFFGRKSKDRGTKLTVDRPTLAMLAQIAQAHEASTGEHFTPAAINKKLVQSYFEAPASPVGKQMTEVMLGHSEAREKINRLENKHPLLDFYDQLPPEAQQAIMAYIKNMASQWFGGQTQTGGGFFG
jgi:hypothetical protein